MKKIVYFIFSAIIISSCASNSKDDPLAPSTTTDGRDRFVAAWDVTENSSLLLEPATHKVTISKSSALSTEIIIDNFSDLQKQVRATVNGNTFIIPLQNLGKATEIIGQTQGSGTLTSVNKISLTYTNTISGTDNISATYIK